MDIFKNRQKKQELVLIFDVGSSSVGGALVLMSKANFPKIIYSKRESIKLGKAVDFNDLSEATLKSLEKIANTISVAGLGSPDKIFCILSSPWYMSETRNIILSKNTPFIFSKKFADSLIKKEVNIFEQECKKKYVAGNSEIVPIELKNIKITLNGYDTQKPLNQKATLLNMSIFVSASEKKILESIKETIGRYFYSKDMKFSSFVMSSFSSVCSTFINQKDFLLVDIGGEITDISMIKDDVLHSSISFPLGENFLIRGVSSILDCSLEEAIPLISLYKNEHMSDSSLNKIEPIIKKLRNEWLSKFQESLSNISNDISVPATVLLTVSQEFSDFFTETIKSEQFSQYILTESKFNVIFLGNQAFNGMVTFSENTLRDPVLVIDSIYVNRLLS